MDVPISLAVLRKVCVRAQCAQEEMYVESRKALTKFAEIHSQSKANLPPRVLTTIMRLVHTIHVEAQGVWGWGMWRSLKRKSALGALLACRAN